MSHRRVVSLVLVAGLLAAPATALAAAPAAPAPAPGPMSAPASPERAAIAARLETLGDTPARAAASAALLTPEDLAVLGANPAMLQRAGALRETTQAFIIGALIVGGLIALAASSSSSGFIMVH